MKVINFKINNQTGALDSPVLTSTSGIIFNWSIESPPGVYQKYSEINIGTSIVGLGSVDFAGNLFFQDFQENSAHYFELNTTQPLSRGKVYYGQIRVRDNLGLESDYEVFSFRINSYPFVISAQYIPETPSLSKDLGIDFTLSKNESSARIFWYKNGELQSNLTDFTIISRASLRVGQSWNAEIIPYDDVEMGERLSLPVVDIRQEIPSVDYVKVIPEYPTENDILSIEYSTVGENSGEVISNDDENQIIWQVNGIEASDFENYKSVRMKFKPNDRIKAIITPSYDGTVGDPVETEEVTIVSDGFNIRGLLVEGDSLNLRVNTETPLLDWSVISPFGRYWKYVKVNIGTYWGADNIFSEIIETFDSHYRIPSGIIRDGGDYYASVAVSDDRESFENYGHVHFRKNGSLWKKYVDNTSGWAMRFVVKTEGAIDGFHDIQISDGSRFFSVSLSLDKIILNETVDGSFSEEVDFNNFVELIISAKGESISLYLDGENVDFNQIRSDGDMKFSVNTLSSERSIKIIPISTSPDDGVVFAGKIWIKEFSYLLDSTFEGAKEALSDMSFIKRLSLPGKSIDFLSFLNGEYFAAINHQDLNESGYIIRMDPASHSVVVSAECLDENSIYVDSIIQSPSGNKTVFSHSQGSSIISGSVISIYDVDTYFNIGEKLDSDRWMLINTPGSSSYKYDNDGLVIDTTSKNIARYDDIVNPDVDVVRNAVLRVGMIGAGPFSGLFFHEFKISDNKFIIYLKDSFSDFLNFISIDLVEKEISQVAKDINGVFLNEGDTVAFGDHYTIEVVGGYGNSDSSILSDSDTWQKIISSSNDIMFYTRSSSVLSSELDPDPYSYVAGGKCFFSHDRPGTDWFDYVNSKNGYTVDLDIFLYSVEDSRRSINTEVGDGFGVYINDGVFEETIEFRSGEIIFKDSNSSVDFDFSGKVNFRFTGKDGGLKVFAKSESDSNHSLVSVTPMSRSASDQAGASSPCIVKDSSGVYHSIWHDDAMGGRGRLWYSYLLDGTWSDPLAIAKSSFGFRNTSVDIDGSDNLHVVFESSGSDYADIAYMTKNKLSWSNPTIIVSDTNNSSHPKISVDENNNIHVVWQDNRYDRYEIYYTHRDGDSGQWNSSSFGGSDLQISSSDNGAFHPDIVSGSNFVFVVWSEGTSSGGSHIKGARLDRNSGVWQGSAIDGVDFQIDSILNGLSDYPSVAINSDGTMHVVWHDINNGNYEIFWRKISSGFTGISDVVQLTSSNKSSRYPSVSVDRSSGNIFIVFQREDLSLLDPYNSIEGNSDFVDYGSKLYYSLYNASSRKWRSSNSNDYSDQFDYEIGFSNDRSAVAPRVPKDFIGNIPLIYSASVLHEYEDRSSQKDIFDNVYFASIDLDEVESRLVQLGLDPYIINDSSVSGRVFRKELRVGDFSDSVSGKMSISYIRYSTSRSTDPFSIRLVNASTSNSTGAFTPYLVNDNGDMWVASNEDSLQKNIEFYDFNKNSFFVLTSEDLFSEVGLPALESDSSGYNNIVIDGNGVMFIVAPDNFGIYVSSDHFHFYKLDFSSTEISGESSQSPVQVAFDRRNNLILAYEDAVYIVYNIERYSLLVGSGGDGSTITIASADVRKIIDNIGEHSYVTGRIEVDDLNTIWIPFKHGLLRIANNNVVLYGQKEGLKGGSVISVSIKSASHRFICCENAVYEMVGDHISKLGLRNSEIAPISLNEQRTQELYPQEFMSNHFVLWTKNDSLLISSLSEVIQLSYLDERFNTKKIGITKFKSSDYALVNEFSSSNFRQNFSIDEYSNVYEYRDFFNVMINGHRVGNGYTFNPFNTRFSFDSPVLPTDLIEVEVQPGMSIINDFSPNNAEIMALGTIIRRPGKLAFQNTDRKVMLVDGTSKSLFLDDVITKRPFDVITLDREPPVGKLIINNVVAPRVLNISIDKLVGGDGIPIPYDEHSGVDKMIISNFDNFTLDGMEPSPLVPFKSNVNHEVGDFIVSSTLMKEFTTELGSALVSFKATGSIEEEMYFGASSPPSIYKKVEDEISLIYLFHEESDDSEISFMTVFQNDLIISVGSQSGVGKLYKTRDLINFELIGSVSQRYITDFAKSPYDQLLYVSAGGGSEYGTGAVYSYDGGSLSIYRDDLFQTVNSIVAFDRFIYAATGFSGAIYRLDVSADTAEIVHVDSSQNILSIGNVGVAVYAGMEASGNIIRSSSVDAHFVNSFNTIPSSVNRIKAITDFDDNDDPIETIYAAVDNNLFRYVNAWTSVVQSTSTIRDFAKDVNGELWVISDDGIQKAIDPSSGVSYIYLKMVDRAGNETSLSSEPDTDGDGYNDNLVAPLDIETLREFTNHNRILELDEFGDVIFDYEGDSNFYSANRIVKEIGIFYTEVFNATNNHVSWDKITWETSTPENTDIKFHIRTGVSRDSLLNSEFSLSLNNSDSGFDLSFLNGQFLQVKVVLISYARDITPSLYKLNITSIATESAHLFTTNFILPSRVKRGILTADKFIPVSADIIFGINTNNSTEFSDYQVISENRLFTTDNQQIGEGLRIGVRLLSPQTADQAISPPIEYGPYGYAVDVNTVEWSYVNTESEARTVNFTVSFYNDVSLSSQLVSYNSYDFSELFRVNGDSFPEGEGYGIVAGETAYVSFIPPSNNPFYCDKEYFTKISIIEDSVEEIISDERSFLYQCGVSFLDEIQFDFQNLGDIQIYDFRIKFYLNEARTSLFKSYFSGNNPSLWLVNNSPFPEDGETFLSGDTKTIEFAVPLDDDGFESGVTYYLAIDAFNGEDFISQNNSYTFRAQTIPDANECGPYSGIPILRSFAIMFELEDGEFVKFNVVE